MDAKAPADNVGDLRVTSSNFPALYHALLGLRFPLEVSQVLELRFLINHAVDRYKRPPPNTETRSLEDALRAAIASFGVGNERHRERLLKILSMLRDLHRTHLVDSRVAELSLRAALEEIRRARSQIIRHGLYSLIATIFAGLTWLGSVDPGWTIKLLTLGLAYMAWDNFHALPRLDAEPKFLTPALNEVLRLRIESVNWKRLIHKLSLILGYKQIPGIVVFHMDAADSSLDRPHILH
jgi:hypothetical protein